MSSLGMLNDYGSSSSDEDVPEGKDNSSQQAFKPDKISPKQHEEDKHTMQALPDIDDLFNGKFNSSNAAAKRSAKSAGLNEPVPSSIKAPKPSAAVSPAVARAINPSSNHSEYSSALLIPPQLKRPNHVTEESAMWNSRKDKSRLVSSSKSK